MTKTKRQLRAEAVERLKEYHDWEPSEKSLGNVTLPIWPMSTDMSNDKRVDALIDLLTDDEPPEGDAVGKLREWLVDEVNDNELKNTWFTVTEQICRLDGMLDEIKREIERDYVRRGDYDKLLAENADDAEAINRLGDERDELAEECSEWMEKAHKLERELEQYERVDEAKEMWAKAYEREMAKNAELAAERDEWKAKAERDGAMRGMTNLVWLYEYDDVFAAGVDYACKYVSGFGIDYDNAREWLMSEHVDTDSGTAEAGTSQVPEYDALADLQAELEAARRERDDCADAAGEAEVEVRRLRERLDAQLPKGVEWPRFEDGALVRFGDKVAHYHDGSAVKVVAMDFDENGVKLFMGNQLPALDRRPYGTPVKRPPLLAADGKPIEVGQVLYGESDGMAWEITRVDGRFAWGDGEKGCGYRLRPEWLTHEEPDSLGLVVATLRQYGDGCVLQKNDMLALADRIEKLAKEGA